MVVPSVAGSPPDFRSLEDFGRGRQALVSLIYRRKTHELSLSALSENASGPGPVRRPADEMPFVPGYVHRTVVGGAPSATPADANGADLIPEPLFLCPIRAE